MLNGMPTQSVNAATVARLYAAGRRCAHLEGGEESSSIIKSPEQACDIARCSSAAANFHTGYNIQQCLSTDCVHELHLLRISTLQEERGINDESAQLQNQGS